MSHTGIGHTFCSMLSIRNELILQNELHIFMLIIFFDNKVNQSWRSNPGPLASQSEALTFGHRVN